MDERNKTSGHLIVQNSLIKTRKEMEKIYNSHAVSANTTENLGETQDGFMDDSCRSRVFFTLPSVSI